MVLNMAISKLSLKMNDKNTHEKLSYPIFSKIAVWNRNLQPKKITIRIRNTGVSHGTTDA